MNKLKNIVHKNFQLLSGEIISVNISFQTFGLDINEGPTVVINHSLTGNSNVAGNNGWWKNLIGPNKMICTNKFCIICINIPGNGIEDFDFNKNWVLNDVARIFIKTLKKLNIKKVHSLIGGSIGGGLVWEMGILEPNYFKNLVPLASDYKSSDWLISNTYLQNLILVNSKNPINDARVHAMLTYRNPKSLNKRFNFKINPENNTMEVINWLEFHGSKLKKNFSLNSYIHMNNLLSTIGLIHKNRNDFKSLINKITSKIHLVGIDSDLLFPNFVIRKTYDYFSKIKKDIYYHKIKSDHGHDAFLIEFNKIEEKISKIFK